MNKTQPIGIFDSGVGGLTVVHCLWKRFPQEQVIYFGDTAHLPYGSRRPEEIIAFGTEIVSFLLQFAVKAVVAACNTSSSLSLPYLRERFPVPIIGMIGPGVRAAARVTRNKRVGVIATKATVESGAYEKAFQECAPDIRVYSQPCPLFVPLIENGCIEEKETYQVARTYLRPLREAGIDTLVFGCTHYPFLAPVIRQILGDGVRLVDPAQEAVKELADMLKLKEGKAPAGEGPRHLFFASGPVTSFYMVGSRLLGGFPYSVEHISLDGRVEDHCRRLSLGRPQVGG
ncbi:glutamate racemase [Thermacetogenium phaeum]|uniref:glutamate racemase n=1 Tax=Thermacetogenium phaeum TaxID=85874 RepID=UPI0003019FD3|nr:glutamate racemase [Thermacetogenium phaeum]